jgi:membrane-bound lytic murein transglycosylase D
LRYDVVTLDDAYGLDQIAKAADVPEAALRELNPQLLSGCTPPNQQDYRLRVPAGAGQRVSSAVAAIPEGERLTWRQHRVQRGETLGQIARRYQTSVDAIMDLNGIRNARSVRAGRVLTIPYPRGVKPPVETQVAAAGSAPAAATQPLGVSEQTHDRVDYRVRKGDTLYSIGQRFGVGVKDLVSWNRLPRSGHIIAGDVLQIWQRRVAPD